MSRPKVLPLLCLALLTLVMVPAFSSPAAAADRAYELRTYIAEDGKLDALNARFRNHTVKLFEKHGMTVVGFWMPTSGEAAANTLIYLLSFPSEQARGEAWRAFGSDPEWQKVRDESEKDGKLLKKIESVMLKPTDYSALR
jgi:hypothetical protein